MNPVQHLLIGWSIAHLARLERRDRAIVTVAAVIPDLDGFGIVPELLTRGTRHEVYWWSEYHHTLGHNVGFAIVVAIAAAVLARSRRVTTLLTILSFHSHLLGDVIGARGPDGFQWPIPYLLPFSDRWQWSWSGQWELNGWQNFAIVIPLLAWTLYRAWRHGDSPVELISTRANAAFVSVLRARFGAPC